MSTATRKALFAAGPTGPEGAWDLSYAYYDSPIIWDVSTATFFGSFSASAQDTAPEGVFFKPDGTKMYVIGNAGDKIYEYSLSTDWVVSTASYVQNFSVSAQESNPRGVFFKPDGTKMYIVGSGGDDVNEYSLSTAWDISTASYVQRFSVSAQESGPHDLFFHPDGIKMYVVGQSGVDINEYTLSTAWDISTASYVQRFSVFAQESNPQGVFFKSDGTKMYVVGITGAAVYEYSLSTAWDISTASYAQSFSVSSRDTIPTGIFFKPDGTKMYVVGNADDKVYEYTLGGFPLGAQEASPSGMFFHPEGVKMYVVGYLGDKVYEYSLSTAWDISTASYVQNFSVGSQEKHPDDVFFKPDGTKMYVVGDTGDDVNEYSLSTAWDISTASYVQNFSVSAQEPSPSGMFFHPDGTKMYIVGGANGAVNEYSLSTAWDVSTASYVQNFSVSAQESNPQGVSFKDDGTKMYVTGTTGDDVNEYSLSTAWDVSTASYVQNFYVGFQDTAPMGLFFHPEGTKMYVVGYSVYTYTLDVQE